MREMRGGVCWDMTSTCVQGSLPRPLGGYQANVMMEPHSPAPAWQMPFVPKQEPMDEDRNDSGINSGSDFHSSSPGSDHSQEYPTFSSPTVSNTQQPYYTTPVTSQYQQRLHQIYNSNMPYHLGFNPLTPPSSEPMVSPKIIKTEPVEQNTTLTPHASPTIHEPKTPDEVEDPLRRLQMSFEKNGFLPSALSPKTTSEHSNDDDNKSDGGLEEFDEEGLRMPKVNSHGKVKTFKCKQCDFVAITKLDFWEHSKGHIKTDKLLTCPKCPFVTEYKHHLEYHLRNHFGSKPFKCDKCNYSCVNKSMLNSHMKSHSNVYQYRCSDCSYATKYCHSLKLHLRKYSHKPAMVLNPDGTPNPLPIIDVYGTRRGPKQKLQQQREENETAPVPQNPFTQLMMNTPPQLQLPFPYPFFSGALGNPLLFSQMGQVDRKSPEAMEENSKECDESFNDCEESQGVLDLSKPDGGEIAPVQKNRRKGRAYKLDRTALQQYHSDEEEKDEVEAETVVEPEVRIVEKEKEEESSSSNLDDYSCQFCNIAFGDVVLYTMHMGYHGYKDPFTCNMCGEQCNDKVAFFLHIARNPHT